MAGLTIWWAHALQNAGAPLESSKPKRDKGAVRGLRVPLPNQLGVWGALYKLLGCVRGKPPAENGFGEI